VQKSFLPQIGDLSHHCVANFVVQKLIDGLRNEGLTASVIDALLAHVASLIGLSLFWRETHPPKSRSAQGWSSQWRALPFDF
jgi:hypothetical protein